MDIPIYNFQNKDIHLHIEHKHGCNCWHMNNHLDTDSNSFSVVCHSPKHIWYPLNFKISIHKALDRTTKNAWKYSFKHIIRDSWFSRSVTATVIKTVTRKNDRGFLFISLLNENLDYVSFLTIRCLTSWIEVSSEIWYFKGCCTKCHPW